MFLFPDLPVFFPEVAKDIAELRCLLLIGFGAFSGLSRRRGWGAFIVFLLFEKPPEQGREHQDHYD
tara:strand:- start:290 stop:487 length:198 start_codon:yes stop_codon:yes gene_type:complete